MGGAPGASRVVAELLATMISIVATILALSSESKIKETTLDRLPSQLDLVKGGGAKCALVKFEEKLSPVCLRRGRASSSSLIL